MTSGGRCAEHKAQADKLRGSSSERGYDARWAKRRKAYLYEHPWCDLCGAPSRVADHYPRSRKTLVSLNATDPDNPAYLRPLCVPCHNKETAKHQPGGWAAK